jgi:hypothetical protein
MLVLSSLPERSLVEAFLGEARLNFLYAAIAKKSRWQVSTATSQTNHNSLLLKKAYQIFGVYVCLPRAFLIPEMMAHDGHEAEKAQNKPSHDPRDFHHPYTPYAIQETFMSTVYQVLEDGKVGILESPTGTVRFLLLNIHVMLASAQGVGDSLHFQNPCNSTLTTPLLGQVTESHMWIVDMAQRSQGQGLRRGFELASRWYAS